MRPSPGEEGGVPSCLSSLAVRRCQIPTPNSCWRVERRRLSHRHQRPRSLRGGVGHHRIRTRPDPRQHHTIWQKHSGLAPPPLTGGCSIKPVVRNSPPRHSASAAPPRRSDIRGRRCFIHKLEGKTASIGNSRRRFVCLNGIPLWGKRAGEKASGELQISEMRRQLVAAFYWNDLKTLVFLQEGADQMVSQESRLVA